MPTQNCTNKYFLVSIHDVATPFINDVLTIIDNVKSEVGSEISLAITANWHGEHKITSTAKSILEPMDWDIVVHGLHHIRRHGSGVVSWLTQRSDEFTGLDLNTALRITNEARLQIEDILGVRVSGFVPPAWQFGPLTTPELLTAGFQYVISYSGIHSKNKSISLANFTWDNGTSHLLGYVGQILGRIQTLLPHKLPCITFHPRDVSTGFDKIGYRLISQLMSQGYLPIKPSRLMKQYEMHS